MVVINLLLHPMQCAKIGSFFKRPVDLDLMARTTAFCSSGFGRMDDGQTDDGLIDDSALDGLRN